MIQEFNKATCRMISADVAEALKEFASSQGLEMTMPGGTFQPTEFTLKVKFVVKATPNGTSGEQAKFEQLAGLFGYKATDYGRTFRSRGELFKMIGFNLRARRMPIIAVRIPDGRRFKFGANVPKREENR